MAPIHYKSLEDGQVVTTDEPRPDLDELARWVRVDKPSEPAPEAPPATPITSTPAAIITTADGTIVGDGVALVTVHDDGSATTETDPPKPAPAAYHPAPQDPPADSGEPAPNPNAVDTSTIQPPAAIPGERIPAIVPEDNSVPQTITPTIAAETNSATRLEKPQGNHGLDAWKAYALQEGLDADRVDGMSRDEIRDLFKSK